MRLSIILIFSAVFTINAAVYSQSKRVTLNLTNVSFSKLFEEIRRQTDYSFFFNNGKINELDKKITVKKTNTTVKEILDEVLAGTSLSYKLVDGVVVIVDNKKIEPQIQQQDAYTISGIITDKVTKEALPGVSIAVKNSKLGTATDIDGKFSIKTPLKPTVLVISYIGYKTREIPISKSIDNMPIQLEVESQDLNEVVVTGYQVIDKRMLTSSVATIEAEELNIKGAVSLDKMLEGKAAGLQVTNLSATPGAAAKIRVRSGSTFTGSQSPLWVIDGVIYEDPVPLSANDINSFDNVNLIGNAISGINPSDIAKIDILKDASATAIYGTRAANGVIVISTKRGKEGKPSMSYASGFSFSQAPTYSNYNLMNSAQRIDVSREIYARNLGYNQSYNNVDRLGYEGALMNLWDGTYTQQQFQDKVSYLETLNSDWFQALYRNSFTQTHSLSASGGSTNARYYFSLGYDDQKGTERNVGLNRLTARSNIDLDIRPNVLVSFKLNGSVQKAHYNHSSTNAFDTAYYTSRTIPIYNEDGSYFMQSQQIAAADSYGGIAYGGYNILKEMANSAKNITNKDFSIVGNIKWDFLKRFRFTSQASYRNTTNLSEEWITEDSFYAAKLRTYEFFEDQIQQRVDLNGSLPFGGVYSGGMVSQDNYSITNQLNYRERIGNHSFNLNLGQEARSIKYWGATGFTVPGYNHYQGRGFIALDYPRLAIDNVNNITYTNFGNYDYDNMINWLTNKPGSMSVYPNITDKTQNFMSFFGIFNYVYSDRYIFNFNMRSDGSNAFGQYERYKFKPAWSVSGRWNIHNEKFFNKTENIDELALRASYGIRGTMPNATPYLTLSNYGRNSTIYYPETVANLSSFPNANLRWEKTATTDLGLNFSLYKGRISGAFDYSYSKSVDLLQSRPVSLVNGAAVQQVNAGSKDVSNYEISVRTINIKTKKLSWSTNFNFSYSKDRVLKGFEDGAQSGLTISNYLGGNIYRAGFPTNGFFSYQFDGLNSNGLPTFKHLVEENMTPEQQLKTALVYQGSRVPLYYGGFGTSLNSGNFTLSANFTYKLGYKTRLLKLYNGNQNLPLPYENMSSEFANRWKQAGDEAITNIPSLSNYDLRFVSNSSANGLNDVYVTNSLYTVPAGSNAWWMYDYSDARVVNASHIRFQAVTLSYNLPSQWIKAAGLNSMNVGLQGSNLGVIAFDKKLKGQDPEQVSGIGMPSVPTYSLSANISF